MGAAEHKTAWGQPTHPLSANERVNLWVLGVEMEETPRGGGNPDAGVLEDPKEMPAYRSRDGGYVTTDTLAEGRGFLRWLIDHRITPQLAHPTHNCCSVGRRPDGSWIGWSHRAAQIFRIGDGLFEERLLEGREDVPFVQIGDRPCQSEEDCKQAAINFAEYIG